MQTITPTKQDWINKTHELGREFEKRSAGYDRDGSFAAENYAALKEHGFFKATIPEELDGDGVSYSTVAEVLRILGQYDGSTALALSMHQHLLAATIWKYRHGQGGEALLKHIAAEQRILISTGARDWLESNGEMIRADGGYRVRAMKFFASQSAVGDLLVTSAPYLDPEKGWQVLHFPVPMIAEGVSVLNDWHTLGMRGTGSQTVKLDGVFVSEGSVTLRRPRGEFHPMFNIVIAVAMPYVMSVYLGIAQKAARIAVETAKGQKRSKPYLPGSIGAMVNQLTSAELNVKDMIRLTNDLDFKPENQLGQEVLARKTNAANACIGVVTKAMEIVGGQGFYESFGLERLFRDVQAANYHPLPAKEQQQSLGEYILGAKPIIV